MTTQNAAAERLRVVRVRRRKLPMGPMNLVVYQVTDLHSRKALGPNHLDGTQARRWAIGQGWRVLGPQP